MDKANLRPVSKKVTEWAKTLIPERYIYYRKSGRHVTCACSACGRVYAGVSEISPDIDGFLERHIPAAHNTTGECPLCGAKAEYKAAGHIRREHRIWRYFIAGQRYKDGFVFRAFCIHRTMSMKTAGKIILPSADIDEINEYARIFLEKGRKADSWWQTWNWQDHTKTWVNYYPGSYGSCHVYEDNYYPGTFNEIKKCELLKYGSPTGPLIRYYSAFARYPDFEIVQKAGMTELEQMLLEQKGANINPNGKTIEDRLRIYRERLPELRKRHGSKEYLRACQYERKNKLHFTPIELEKHIFANKKSRTQADNDTIREILKHTSLLKVIRYLDRVKYEQHQTESIWLDYIRMRAHLGHDLDNDVYLFPKDLRRKHDELMDIINKERNDKRKAEMLARFPEVKEKYPKLKRKYTFSDGNYMIRPAKNAAEIVEEGRILHHCVGSSDTYFKKIAKGDSFILFLRAADAPDTPLATVEIRGCDILQWYEADDDKPDEDILQPWLDNYTRHLGGRNGRTRNTVSGGL